MGIFEQFPYTNLHNLNLDWIIENIQSADESVRASAAAALEAAAAAVVNGEREREAIRQTGAEVLESIPADYTDLSNTVEQLAEGTFVKLESNTVDRIENDADLNDYKTPGNYRVNTSTIAASLVNSPSTTAGRLTVLETTQAERIIQLYRVNNFACDSYARYFNGTSWGAWVKAATTNVTDELKTDVETRPALSTVDVEALTITDDLNNYKTPGNKKITTSDLAFAIANCPSKSGGRLFIMTSVATDRIMQTYIENSPSCAEYRRWCRGDTWTPWVEVTKSFKMLVFGNSFTQDAVAYLPAVLAEALPDYHIIIGNCYTSGANIADHLAWYDDSTPYTVYSEWNGYQWNKRTNAFTPYAALYNHSWDTIWMQGTCNVMNDTAYMTDIVEPLIAFAKRLLPGNNKPFSIVTAQWVARTTEANTTADIWNGIKEKIQLVYDKTPIMDVIPIGCAFQNARSVSAVNSLGDSGEMLYDGSHIQAGLPALLASYTIALKVMEWVGRKANGIIGWGFFPSEINVEEINVVSANSAMTHGEIVGMTEENIWIAQQAAIYAVRNPNEPRVLT